MKLLGGILGLTAIVVMLVGTLIVATLGWAVIAVLLELLFR